MSSSDSDDDCFGNVVKKLESIKSKYQDVPVIPSENLLKTAKNAQQSVVKDANITINSTDNDECFIDAIIANNPTPTTKGRRRSKRKAVEDDFEPLYERVTRSSRRKTREIAGTDADIQKTAEFDVIELDTSVETPAKSSSKGNTTRGRGSRGKSRGGARGTARGRRGGRRGGTMATDYATRTTSVYPTFSIGNTEEYPDQSNTLDLFATKTSKVNESIDNNVSLDLDNEELSVKVYWQSFKIFRFTIRKHQKLTQIYEYFAKNHNVSFDKLLFTYNEKVLKMDDTPDSINYSIAKFIEGGYVNQKLTDLIKTDNVKNLNSGLKIKFQCENVKKPYETMIQPDDKLALSMMKCAEHLEVSLDKLRFYFDGDQISSKSTASDLELEGGECIDVKIVS